MTNNDNTNLENMYICKHVEKDGDYSIYNMSHDIK